MRGTKVGDTEDAYCKVRDGKVGESKARDTKYQTATATAPSGISLLMGYGADAAAH